MAVFKVPRISSVNRRAIVLEPSEIVFDIDDSRYYGGDGQTLGGFLIGPSIQTPTNTLVLTVSPLDAQAKSISLPRTPLSPSTLSLTPAGGIPQINGIDFAVSGNVIQWAGLGLSGFIEAGDKLIVSFQ